MPVSPIPEGYHTVTPYLIVPGVKKLIAFLKEAFGAEQVRCTEMPDGTVAHAELRIGTSMLMLGEASEKWKPMPATLYLYVEDTDALYRRAMEAGATSVLEPTDQFYGDRNAGVQDFAGNYWWIGTHQEDVSDEEIQRRAQAYKAKAAG